MKIFAALFFSCCLLSGNVARAEKIDFSTTTCKQFMDSHKDAIGVVLAWLDGTKSGPVAGLVGIEGGVVSGVINLESLGVRAPSRRPRHENRYHDA